MTFSLSDLVYKPLGHECPLDGFRCGEAELESWFRKNAKSKHLGDGPRVTTAHYRDNPEPIGFYAMGLILEPESNLERQSPLKRLAKGRFFTALHLEYLAVATEWQGQGIGSNMLIRAIEAYRYGVIELGVPLMTLVALNDDLVAYYERHSFIRYGQHVSKRMLMMPPDTVLDLPRAMSESQ